MKHLTRLFVIALVLFVMFTGYVGSASNALPIGPQTSIAASTNGEGEEEMSAWDWIVEALKWLAQNGEWPW